MYPFWDDRVSAGGRCPQRSLGESDPWSRSPLGSEDSSVPVAPVKKIRVLDAIVKLVLWPG